MKIHLAYGLLSALTLVGISPQYAVAQDDYSDTRIAIDLTQAEQAHVRSRMLDLLSGVQAMTEAAANDDLDWFREVADQLSTTSHDRATRSMQTHMPDGFRQISRSLNRDLASLSELSDQTPMGVALDQLAMTLSNCTSCHGSYRVTPTED